MNRWQIRIIGDLSIVESLHRILPSGQHAVLKNSYGYVYASQSFDSCDDIDEVRRLAELELAALSGVLKFSQGTLNSLSFDAIIRRNEDGGDYISMILNDAMSLRDELTIISSNTPVPAGQPTFASRYPRPDPTLALLALSNTDVAKVFRLLGANDVTSWVGLYRIFEVVQAGLRHRKAALYTKVGAGNPRYQAL